MSYITQHVPPVAQVLRSAILGACGTFTIGSLGIYLVNYIQGRAFNLHAGRDSPVLLVTCGVAALSLSLFYLYKKTGVEDSAFYYVREQGFPIITTISAAIILGMSKQPLTGTLAKALAATFIFWAIIADTVTGQQIFGLRKE